MATPGGIGRIQVQPQGLAALPEENQDAGPEACRAIPVEKLRPTEVLRCAEQSLLISPAVRIETYAHVSDTEDGNPRVSVEVKGVYSAPDRMQAKLLLTLWGASQHRSDVIQAEGHRYVRSENYNQVSGERVVTPGWAKEPAPDDGQGNILGIMGLDYATRFVADRGGFDPPDSLRCGDSEVRLVRPGAGDDRKHLVVQVQSSEVAADGIPCRGGVLMTETHWIDRLTFRPWRVLLEAVPLSGPKDDDGQPLDEQIFWRGQTVYSSYDSDLVIEPPG